MTLMTDSGHSILMKISAFLTLLLFMLQGFIVQSQIIQPRTDYGAMLEPKGRIINGAGQDLAGYNNYWDVMHSQGKPVIYMTYLGVKTVTSDWSTGLKADLMSHPDKFLVPQIGLSMASDGTPSSHYEQDVAAGLYDDQILMFIEGLKSLAFPAYVRIGYEFNGTLWNGYQAETYKTAFRRITDMIRASGVEAATVWDFSMDGVMNYMDYYPGDSYVDWWAINLFSASHFTDSYANSFMEDANSHNKPVMIGETTPRYVGVLDGQQSWNSWFAPFFTFIHNYPGLKAFSYINWDWSQYPQWWNWGDARIEQNAYVGGAFASEMDSAKYLHASGEHDFRKTFGLADNTAPPVPGTVTVDQSVFPFQLNWDNVSDPSGLSHYIIYKHGVLSDYSFASPWFDQNIAAGDTITYAVSAMDRAGNESQQTAKLKITVPSPVEKALNGEFDHGLQNWILSTYDAAVASVVIDPGSVLSGPNSCKVTLSQTTGTDWHAQLWQWLSVHKGRKYKVTYEAKASTEKDIRLVIQQAASPYHLYYYQTHHLNAGVQSFTDTVTISVNDQARLAFMVGTTTTGMVWIDNVTISESVPASFGTGDEPEMNPALSVYPNPCRGIAGINFMNAVPGFVSLSIADANGKMVATLVNEKKGAGTFSAQWNAAGQAPGIYFCILKSGKATKIQKILLLHE